MFIGKKIVKSMISCVVIVCVLCLCGCIRKVNDNLFTGSPTFPVGDSNTPDTSTLLEDVKSDVEVEYSDFDVKDAVGDAAPEAVRIVLNDSNTYVDAESFTGIAVSNENNQCTVSITEGGTYLLAGKLSDGQIYVEAGENQVRLILDGVDIHCSDSAPIYLNNGKKTVITLASGSVNTLTDTKNYEYAVTKTNEETGEVSYEPNGTLFSKKSLTINGSGSLVIEGNCNNGLSCKDELKIIDANVSSKAVNNGIKGNDWVVIHNSNITVESDGDGIKSDKEDNALKGFICVDGGNVNVTAGEDGLQAVTTVAIYDGNITVNASVKGIKSDNAMLLAGGNVSVTAGDDGLHVNDFMDIVGGKITISAQDDGMHADNTIDIKSGTINITKSYEGIEAACIVVDGGSIDLVASDDGFNASNGLGMGGMGGPGGMGRPGGFGRYYGATEGNGSSITQCSLTINNGYIYVNASGDGLDSNGSITINGGTIIVNGPTNSGNGALDSGDGGYEILVNGGILVAAGASGMAEVPSSNSKQNIVSINISTSDSDLAIVDSNGNSVVQFDAIKQYQSVIISSPSLVKGEMYSIYLRNNSDSSSGTELASFTISSVITTIGSGGGMGGGMGGGFGGGPGGGGRPGRW